MFCTFSAQSFGWNSFLCAGGASYALFISLLVSKLFCAKAYMDVGRGGPGQSKFTLFRIFFGVQMALASLIAISGPQNLSLDFQGTLLPMAFDIDFPASKLLRTVLYTAKTKYRNFETNIPRKGISGSQFQFPKSCVCEWFIYSHDRSAYSAGGNMETNPGTI
jgi:hypothetical protein